MNYYGVVLDKTISEEIFNKVLRPALMQVDKTDILPLRGPKETYALNWIKNNKNKKINKKYY